MEFDDFKSAWQTLDRRLEQQNALNLRIYTEGTLGKARSRLRPLLWGQLAQIVFGLLSVALGIGCWSQHRDAPVLFVSGVIVHVYGVLAIAMAGITLGLIQRIDYAAPVLEIQQQLARLRRFYLINGLVTGMSWWLLWIPFLIALSGLDGNTRGQPWASSFLIISSGIGVAGLLVTWGLQRWSRSPRRARLGRVMDDAMAGGSLRRAEGVLDELARFERE